LDNKLFESLLSYKSSFYMTCRFNFSDLSPSKWEASNKTPYPEYCYTTHPELRRHRMSSRNWEQLRVAATGYVPSSRKVRTLLHSVVLME